jgi:16S rRNA (cytidine1402-2'-O)-methyltransferase
VARELTKRFEEVRRGPLDELAAFYAAAAQPKGEIVILVGPPGANAAEAEMSEGDIDAALEKALLSHSVREASSLVAAETGLPRRAVYARALKLRGDPSD